MGRRSINMQWLTWTCLLVAVFIGGGVTKTPDHSAGISQFWTDDYKVFDQIYGKTSDKDIYGATLPPAIGYGIDTKENEEASEKKERYITHQPLQDGDVDAYADFGSKYNELLKKQQAFNIINKAKSTKPPLNFISSDFKPITKTNDPDTYNYLKHLEKLQKYKEVADYNVGFKPYVNYAVVNPQDGDAYKSIQDILKAHEANKGRVKDNQETDDQVKYLTYGGPKGTKKLKPSAPLPPSPKSIRSQCSYGRCRKRATNTYRVLKRPIVRKIKHKIIRY